MSGPNGSADYDALNGSSNSDAALAALLSEALDDFDDAGQYGERPPHTHRQRCLPMY